MQILSAADAISPAFARTKLVLFTPFRKGRTWKLSITAYLSFVGTIFMPFMLLYLMAAPLIRRAAGVGAEIGLVVVCLLLTVVYVVVFVLCGRLQFAFFDITLNHGEFVAPAWHKYKDQSKRWTSTKMLIGFVVLLLVSGPMVVMFRHLAPVFLAMKASQPGQPPPPEFMSLMAAFYGAYAVAMLFFGCYYLAMATLSSFVVPSMALENLPVRAALMRFWAFVRREPGQFTAYVLLRIALGLAGYFGLIIIYEIALLILIFIVGGVLGLMGLALHLMGIPSPLLLGFGFVLGGIILFAANIYLSPLVIGPFFTFFEAHTLYFLGGRYPMLGEALERSTPPAEYVQPHYPYSQG